MKACHGGMAFPIVLRCLLACFVGTCAYAIGPIASAGEPRGGQTRDITFISTSDSHYRHGENPQQNQWNRESIDQINGIAGASWPEKLGGGVVQRPRGVVILGDCIDDGDRVIGGKNISEEQFRAFVKDVGLDGTDGVLKFPVFEGWGNHDGPPVGQEKNRFSFQSQLKRRNAIRLKKGLISNLSANGLHYSWDWDDVHFVQLNIYPADQQREGVHYSPVWHHPQGSLSFLKEDLAKNVGTSNRPVVLLAHCGFDTNWWVAEDWKQFYAAARPYNVILYLYGHTGTGLHEWAPEGKSRKLTCINDGNLTAGFFVVQIKGNQLRAAYRTRAGVKLAREADGTQQRQWEGQWEWKFPLNKTFDEVPVADRFQPCDPEPADGTEVEEKPALLQWEPADPRTRSYRAFLSTERGDVEAMKESAACATVSAPKAMTGTLLPGKTYFWRVQQLDDSRKPLDSSPVWRFSVSAGPATSPQPRNRVAGVSKSIGELVWKPGRHAVSQDLYFGVDSEQVARSTTPTLKALPPTTDRVAIPGGPLEYGRTYYWRVAQNNGAVTSPPSEVWAFRIEDEPRPDDLTFFVVSDTHYGLSRRGDAVAAQLVDCMNWTPGATYPDSVGGGIVRTPCAVLHLGDATNDGRADQWEKFQRDFGSRGEGRLAWPVFNAFGNHDGGPESAVRQGVKQLNERRAGLSGRSANGMHCSWDWNGVHFLCLGVSIGSTTRPYDPQYSYEFLKAELEKHGRDGRPMILLHHFGMDPESVRWWPEEARSRYRDLLRGYNIAGIFHGHDHQTRIYQWEGIDVFDVPHLAHADGPADRPATHGFFVVNISGNELRVAQRNVNGTWGLQLRKPLRK